MSAVLTPDNFVDELERVLSEALRQSMPAYLVISEVNGGQPVLGSPVTGTQLALIKRQRSVPQELEAAVATILSRLEAARSPVAILTHLVSRYGVRDKALAFLAKANLPTAVTPNDKGTMDEGMPQYIGLNAGRLSSSAAVSELVSSADLVLDIGGIVTTELNTGFWTGHYDHAVVVSINDNWVRAGDKVFVNVAVDDVLKALTERVSIRCSDQLGDAFGLVGGQGVLRIDEDRLDALLADRQLLAAVLQNGQQESLGFAGPRAGGHQGVLRRARLQPFVGLLLVAVGRKGQRDETSHGADPAGRAKAALMNGPLTRRCRSARKRSIRPLKPGVVG